MPSYPPMHLCKQCDTYSQVPECARCKLREAEAENKRLQDKIADQSLTLCVLHDSLAKVHDTLRERATVLEALVDRCQTANSKLMALGALFETLCLAYHFGIPVVVREQLINLPPNYPGSESGLQGSGS